jgi:hypothetical protein
LQTGAGRVYLRREANYMDTIITNQDVVDLRNSYGADRFKIIDKIRQRGFENALKDLGLSCDLNAEWRNRYTGTESLLKDILNKYTYKSVDDEIPYILENWEANIGINPVKDASEKMTKEDAYQRVVNSYSHYKEWKEHGHTIDYIYGSIRSGGGSGSFVYGGHISVGGYLGGKNIGSDKILVSWESGKHFIFTVRQVLEDALGESKDRQLSLF